MLLRLGEESLERAETIIAPGAATSGLFTLLRKGPSLLKSEMSPTISATVLVIPSMSLHCFFVVKAAQVMAPIAQPGDPIFMESCFCLLYTSDAADERSS